MKRRIWRTAMWTSVLTAVFVLMSGATAIALVVADWLFTETDAQGLSWAVGGLIIMGFSLSVGTGLGIMFYWIHLRDERIMGTKPDKKDYHVTDTMENLLITAQREGRD